MFVLSISFHCFFVNVQKKDAETSENIPIVPTSSVKTLKPEISTEISFVEKDFSKKMEEDVLDDGTIDL